MGEALLIKDSYEDIIQTAKTLNMNILMCVRGNCKNGPIECAVIYTIEEFTKEIYMLYKHLEDFTALRKELDYELGNFGDRYTELYEQYPEFFSPISSEDKEQEGFFDDPSNLIDYFRVRWIVPCDNECFAYDVESIAVAYTKSESTMDFT
jgi:transcriptional regulator of heat shock response